MKRANDFQSRTSISSRRWTVGRSFVATTILLLVMTRSAFAHDVVLVGVMGSRAVLAIDGGSPRVVNLGSEVAGVKLVRVTNTEAVVEISGDRRTLQLGSRVISTPARSSEMLVLYADSRGHFTTRGTVNGATVRFIVDTGATLLSLGKSDAQRAGLDYRRIGQNVIAQTAGGNVSAWRVTVANLELGSIKINNVDALVFDDDLPVALLGMSVLNQMELRQSGTRLELERKR